MISDDLKRLVEKTFSDAFGPSEDDDEAEFRKAIFEALEAGHNLAFFGQERGCEKWEIAALKKIDEAYQSGIVPESV